MFPILSYSAPMYGPMLADASRWLLYASTLFLVHSTSLHVQRTLLRQNIVRTVLLAKVRPGPSPQWTHWGGG